MKIVEGTGKGRVFLRAEADGTYSIKYIKQAFSRWDKKRLETKIEKLLSQGFQKRDHFIFEGEVKIKRGTLLMYGLRYNNKIYAEVKGVNNIFFITDAELFNLLRGVSLGMYETVGESTFVGLFHTSAQSGGMLSIHAELAGI